jgi:hypothetical protein
MTYRARFDEAQQELVAAWSVKTATMSPSMKGRKAGVTAR